jgi:hypothetical protein
VELAPKEMLEQQGEQDLVILALLDLVILVLRAEVLVEQVGVKVGQGEINQDYLQEI